MKDKWLLTLVTYTAKNIYEYKILQISKKNFMKIIKFTDVIRYKVYRWKTMSEKEDAN